MKVTSIWPTALCLAFSLPSCTCPLICPTHMLAPTTWSTAAKAGEKNIVCPALPCPALPAPLCLRPASQINLVCSALPSSACPLLCPTHTLTPAAWITPAKAGARKFNCAALPVLTPTDMYTYTCCLPRSPSLYARAPAAVHTPAGA